MRGKLTTGKLSYIINPYKGAELGIPVSFEKKFVSGGTENRSDCKYPGSQGRIQRYIKHVVWRKVCRLNVKIPCLVPRLQEVRIIFSPLWRIFQTKEKECIYSHHCNTVARSGFLSYCSCNKLPQMNQLKIIKKLLSCNSGN